MRYTLEEIEEILRYYFGDIIVDRILQDLQDMRHAETPDDEDA